MNKEEKELLYAYLVFCGAALPLEICAGQLGVAVLLFSRF